MNTKTTAPTLPEYEIDCTKADIKAVANFKHAQYPQYAGHWDDPEWVLVQITTDIKTKMGKAFHKGELALAKRGVLEDLPVWVAYSRGNNCDTIIGLHKAVQVQAA